MLTFPRVSCMLHCECVATVNLHLAQRTAVAAVHAVHATLGKEWFNLTPQYRQPLDADEI